MLPQQDVNGLRHRVAQLTLGAHRVLAALGVLAVCQAVLARDQGKTRDLHRPGNRVPLFEGNVFGKIVTPKLLYVYGRLKSTHRVDGL